MARTMIQRARDRARELAHDIKARIGLPACPGEQHDWPCDRLLGTIAGVIVQTAPAAGDGRVECPVCKRRILLVRGRVRAHGFSFGERDRCEGSGRAA